MSQIPPFRSLGRAWRAVAVVLAVAAATTGVAAGAGAAPARPTGTAAPSVATARAATTGPAPGSTPVASLHLQGRTVLYKPGAHPDGGSPVQTVAPSQTAPSGAAARADAGSSCPGQTTTFSQGPTAKICVSYTGFDNANLDGQAAQAIAAYKAAVDVWAHLLSSPVTIEIAVNIDPTLGGGVLAATGPNGFYQLKVGGPWYPAALSNALTNSDPDGADTPDIVSTMGSSSDDQWYFGTDGKTPSGQYDFESVAMHEIGHGLGIFSLTDADDPSYGCPSGRGCVGNGFNNLPSVYDTWLVATLSASSTSVGWLTTGPQGQPGAFGNYTAALRGALTGWNPAPSSSVLPCSAAAQDYENSRVLWAGPEATAANLNTWPNVYSPNPWNPGSSISHLDCHHYAWPGANSLLTPYVPDGEAVHAPGPIILGMLRDIGWTETVAPMITGTLAAGPTPNPASGKAYVQWKPATYGVDGVSPVTGYRIQSAPAYGYPGSLQTTEVPASAASTVIDNLTTGAPYWVSVAPLSAAPGPAYAANVVPQDLGPTYGNLISLVNALVPNFLGGPNTSVANGVLLQLSYPNTTTTVQELVAINAFVLDPVLGPLTRLYLAYFGRLPDAGGTSYWLGRLRSGTPLTTVSDGFAASPEFTSTYGSLSNGQFVTQVYQNVLGRAPDSGGYSYWLNRLNTGMTRGQLMVNFSESAEFKNAKAGTVQVVEGFWGMRQKIPTTTQVNANAALTASQLFQGLLDQTIS